MTLQVKRWGPVKVFRWPRGLIVFCGRCELGVLWDRAPRPAVGFVVDSDDRRIGFRVVTRRGGVYVLGQRPPL